MRRRADARPVGGAAGDAADRGQRRPEECRASAGCRPSRGSPASFRTTSWPPTPGSPSSAGADGPGGRGRRRADGRGAGRRAGRTVAVDEAPWPSSWPSRRRGRGRRRRDRLRAAVADAAPARRPSEDAAAEPSRQVAAGPTPARRRRRGADRAGAGGAGRRGADGVDPAEADEEPAAGSRCRRSARRRPWRSRPSPTTCARSAASARRWSASCTASASSATASWPCSTAPSWSGSGAELTDFRARIEREDWVGQARALHRREVRPGPRPEPEPCRSSRFPSRHRPAAAAGTPARAAGRRRRPGSLADRPAGRPRPSARPPGPSRARRPARPARPGPAAGPAPGRPSSRLTASASAPGRRPGTARPVRPSRDDLRQPADVRRHHRRPGRGRPPAPPSRTARTGSAPPRSPPPRPARPGPRPARTRRRSPPGRAAAPAPAPAARRSAGPVPATTTRSPGCRRRSRGTAAEQVLHALLVHQPPAVRDQRPVRRPTAAGPPRPGPGRPASAPRSTPLGTTSTLSAGRSNSRVTSQRMYAEQVDHPARLVRQPPLDRVDRPVHRPGQPALVPAGLGGVQGRHQRHPEVVLERGRRVRDQPVVRVHHVERAARRRPPARPGSARG